MGAACGGRVTALVTGYDDPAAWEAGADPIYEQLSRAAIESCRMSISGRVILDLGAGTGATSRAILRSHAWPVAVDLSYEMLAHRSGSRPPAAVADATALPFADGMLGGAISAFCLSHVDSPDRVVAELARVVEPGGPVITVVFSESGARHPVSAAVADAAEQLGWVAPDWYRRLKEELEPAVADADRLRVLGRNAGLLDVTVDDTDVDTGIYSAEELIRWRLAGPALASFFQELPELNKRRLIAGAARALGDEPSSLLLRIRTMSGASS